MSEIVAIVAKYYGLPQKQLKSSSRKHAVVQGRATIIYLARELTGASYDEIGRALGGRDHTTIMHNYKKIERDRQRDLATPGDARRFAPHLAEPLNGHDLENASICRCRFR